MLNLLAAWVAELGMTQTVETRWLRVCTILYVEFAPCVTTSMMSISLFLRVLFYGHVAGPCGVTCYAKMNGNDASRSCT